MKVLAAVLLALLSIGVISSSNTTSVNVNTNSAQAVSTTESQHNKSASKLDISNTTTVVSPTYSTAFPRPSNNLSSKWESNEEKILEQVKPFIDPKNILLQEIDTLDKETSNSKVMV